MTCDMTAAVMERICDILPADYHVLIREAMDDLARLVDTLVLKNDISRRQLEMEFNCILNKLTHAHTEEVEAAYDAGCEEAVKRAIMQRLFDISSAKDVVVDNGNSVIVPSDAVIYTVLAMMLIQACKALHSQTAEEEERE